MGGEDIKTYTAGENETLETMLKRVVHSLGLVEHSNENPRRKNKVKRKHRRQDKTKENSKTSVPNGVTVPPNESIIHENCEVKEANWLGEEKVNIAKMNMSRGGEDAEDSFFSAKEFYVSKGKSSIRYSRRKGIKGKKPFVAPLPTGRLYRGLGWKPSLATVDDLSP